MWQEPDLADVDVPGVAVICGHNDVLGVLRGEPCDKARVEETHLKLKKQITIPSIISKIDRSILLENWRMLLLT